MNYELELNENQLAATITDSQHVRIIAGAGSGKTRVLTYRIAYLIERMGVDPWNILAITFTNKVASEMKSRIGSMLPDCTDKLHIRTFHSFAAFFLRHEISSIGFPASFSILDEEDQTKLVKDIAVDMGFKRSDKIVSRALSYIGSCKLKGKYPDDITIIKPAFEDERTCLDIYTTYEETKNKMLSLDFDDLLLKANYILENFPLIRIKWQNRFNHILVDEFQDTNDVEYKLLTLLLKDSTSLYVVGDPDQTIYTWRGANQAIILDMNKRYLDLNTIILDRNYRSSQNILNSANKLISYNKLRVPKDLYTKADKGEPIVCHSSPSTASEADFVAREIAKLKAVNGYKFKDIAILYRSNYVTVDFESALTSKGIPYKIYGGQKFYQRREIKDVLAYFHLIVNVKDNISFERIMNVPRRNIGEMTALAIRNEASSKDQSLYEYIASVDGYESSVSHTVLNKLKIMITIIEEAKAKIEENDEVFSKTLEKMITDLGYFEYLQKEDDGDDRITNVKALFEDIRHFLKNNPESTFEEYLQNISLLSAQDELVDGDFVTLMTVHTAKGLEYPVVFVVRFNNGVFPNMRAQLENSLLGLEEERRLAYVAITRAKERLYLTSANAFSYVIGTTLSPSQFYKESGNDVLRNDDLIQQSYNPYRSSKPSSIKFNDGPNQSYTPDAPIKQNFSQVTNGLDESDWKIGDIVMHKKFGKGIVIGLEGDDIITVDFESCGKKSIMGNHPFVSKGGNEA